jgi:predicted ATPase
MSGHRAYARADLEALARELRGDAGAVAAEVPMRAGELVGRARELERVLRLVSPPGALVTLVGPAGIGKTTLAEHVAAQAAKLRTSRVVSCPLAEAATASDVVSKVADAAGVDLPAGLDHDARAVRVGRGLARAGDVLVVLDNLEQVLADAADLVRIWRKLAPNVRWLATSRERLRVSSEQVLEVPPLDVPAQSERDPASIRRHSAAALFLARAAAAHPVDLRRDAAAVVGIVRALDGIPLALELAAARLFVLSPAELLPRLDERFAVLARRGGRAAGRQATLRNAIDWSWRLLDVHEQSALAQLSIFRGGFSLAAAEAVVRLGPEAPSVLALVESLCAKSLVRIVAETSGSDARRFDMYLSIREYAAERLGESGIAKDAATRHARFYAKLADGIVHEAPSTPAGIAEARLTLERDNLRAAHAHALSTAPELALALALAIEHSERSRASLADLLALLDAALERGRRRTRDERLLGRVRAARGRLLLERGSLRESERELGRALALARAARDPALEEYASSLLGIALIGRGRRGAALRIFARARAIGERSKSDPSRRFVLAHRGSVQHEAGLLTEAEASYREALGLGRSAGDDVFAARILARLGRVWSDMGEAERGRQTLERALETLHATNDRYEGWCLAHLAIIARREGRLDTARVLYERACGLFSERGAIAVEAMHRGFLAAVQADLGRAADAIASLEAARADASLLDDEMLVATLSVCEGHLELLSARAARRPPRDALRARIEEARKLGTRDKDLRAAADLLDAAIEAQTSGAASLPDRPALVVAADATWLTPPAGDRVQLARRGPLRRLFAAMIDARRAEPGRALDAGAAFALGWPGERASAKASAARVYAAMAELRETGLGAALVSARRGYWLDPGVPLRIEVPDQT